MRLIVITELPFAIYKEESFEKIKKNKSVNKV